MDNRIVHMALKVENLEETTAFYQKVFGFWEVETRKTRDHLSRHLTDGAMDFTLIKYDDFRVILTALQANVRVPEHKTEGRITIHVLSGHLQVKASGRTFSLRTGGVLALDRGILHDVQAVEESAFLLTIAWPGRG